MFKKITLVALSLFFAFSILSCSSGEKAKQVCDALITKIYAACDQQSDAALIAQYLDNFFDDVTADYIRDGSPDEFESDCVADFGGDLDDVPQELIDEAVNEANDVTETDCETALQELSIIAATFQAYAAANWDDWDLDDWTSWF